MLFGEERDWKELMNEESQVELADLIEKTKKHRSAYMQADDVKVAQLWAAMTEISRSVKMLECKLCKIESMIKEFSQIGETAKRDTLRERVGDLFKPKTSKEREQVEKVVDSLMEF